MDALTSSFGKTRVRESFDINSKVEQFSLLLVKNGLGHSISKEEITKIFLSVQENGMAWSKEIPEKQQLILKRSSETGLKRTVCVDRLGQAVVCFKKNYNSFPSELKNQGMSKRYHIGITCNCNGPVDSLALLTIALDTQEVNQQESKQPQENKQIEKLMKEITSHRRFSHLEGVVKLRNNIWYSHATKSFPNHSLQKCMIIMEHAKKGNLEDAIKTRSLTAFDKKKIILKLVDVLKEIHADGRLHGDLKSANCLLDPKNNLLLTDFEYSVENNTASTSIRGSPLFLPPEILFHTIPEEDPTYKNLINAFGITQTDKILYSTMQDVWALGILFLELKGLKPFWFLVKEVVGANTYVLIGNVCKEFIREDYEEKFLEVLPHCREPGTIDHLLRQIFEYNKDNRPTMEQILKKLSEIDSISNKDSLLEWFSR